MKCGERGLLPHRALPRWIPACAGMTSEVRGEEAFALPRPAPLDSRLRGIDELECRGLFIFHVTLIFMLALRWFDRLTTNGMGVGCKLTTNGMEVGCDNEKTLVGLPGILSSLCTRGLPATILGAIRWPKRASCWCMTSPHFGMTGNFYRCPDAEETYYLD